MAALLLLLPKANVQGSLVATRFPSTKLYEVS